MSWRLAFCCLLLSATGCRSEGPDPPFTAALFALEAEARGELGLSLPSTEQARRALQHLREKLAPLRKAKDARTISRLNATIFDELGYRRDLRREALEPSLLSAVLVRRVGSCAGLGALYLVLAEQLELPLRGVLLPGHFYVRHQPANGPEVDIELLRRGASMDAAWYKRRYAPPQSSRDYGRPLAPDESLAVLRYNLANAYARAQKVDRALTLYRGVVERLPGFAEAHAQLGQLLLARGDVAGARAAFAAAKAAHPALPGLQATQRALVPRARP